MEAPKNMKGVIMGVYYLTCGIGSLIATIISEIGKNFDWFCHTNNPDYCNPNSGSMYNYFWTLACLQIVATFVYYIMAAIYRCFRERGEVRSWSSVFCFLFRY